VEWIGWNIKSYSELELALERLLGQELPAPTPPPQVNFVDSLRSKILKLVRENPGLRIGDIAKAVGQTIDLTQVAVRPMVDKELRIEGPK
jgi:Winged helix-turn-helix DNA-binding